MERENELHKYHRFLDEAGDTSFYGRGGVPIFGENGVSNCFILGMVSFNEDIGTIRNKIFEFQSTIQKSSYYASVPSVKKRVEKGGFYFHAKDDLPELKKEFYDFIKGINCSFEAVVGRKIVKLYETKHNGRSSEFYADLLSHLIKDKLKKHPRLVLNIASRESSTSYQNLQSSLEKSVAQFFVSNPTVMEIETNVEFNVQPFSKEPLLSVADYFCWSIQRVFEKGETRFYDYLIDQIPLVVDLYDRDNYDKDKNIYTPKNPLTYINKMSPQSL
jgi:hypothetical protein